MKHTTVVIAIMFLCSVLNAETPSTTLPGTQPAAPKTKDVQVNGVKLTVPEGWVIDQSKKYGVPLVLKHPQISDNGINVTFIVMDATEKMPVEQFKEKIRDLASKRNLTVKEDREMQVGAFPQGYYALLENEVGGDRLFQAVYYAQFEGKFLMAVCTAKGDGYSECQGEFEKIIKTIQQAK